MHTDTDGDRADDESPANAVYLRGRLAAPPIEKTLPSGDILLSFRLTVDRPVNRRPTSRVRVDSIECVAVRAGLRRIVGRAAPGDELEVEGSLQRRFWRGPAGAASRYTVAVDSVRRTSVPVRPSRRRADA